MEKTETTEEALARLRKKQSKIEPEIKEEKLQLLPTDLERSIGEHHVPLTVYKQDSLEKCGRSFHHAQQSDESSVSPCVRWKWEGAHCPGTPEF